MSFARAPVRQNLLKGTFLASLLFTGLSAGGALGQALQAGGAGADIAGQPAKIRWAYCTGVSDTAVLASDVFKVPARTSLDTLNENWQQYLLQRHGYGGCTIVGTSKAVAYSSMDSAIADAKQQSGINQIEQTGWTS